MIPADILIALLWLAKVVLGASLVWLLARWGIQKIHASQDRAWERAHERTRRLVEENSGDQGGMPRRAGDMDPIEGD